MNSYRIKSSLGAVLLSLLLNGCAFTISDGPPLPREVTLDGVKKISVGNRSGQDASSYNQDSYLLDSDNRLLLRFESLAERAMQIDLKEGKTVDLTVFCLSTSCIPGEAPSLKLCPVTRDWMMLATWEFAHPFGPGGKWSKTGGDYESASCIHPEEIEFDPDSPPSPNAPVVAKFNVASWILNYAQGRKTNNGWILIAEVPVEIHGETSGVYSPRLRFDEHVLVPVFPTVENPKPSKKSKRLIDFDFQ